MKFKQWIRYNKEGVVIGAIVGVLLYYFNPLFIDNLLNLPELGWHRLSILILISSSIGALIDSKWRPRR